VTQCKSTMKSICAFFLQNHSKSRIMAAITIEMTHNDDQTHARRKPNNYREMSLISALSITKSTFKSIQRSQPFIPVHLFERTLSEHDVNERVSHAKVKCVYVYAFGPPPPTSIHTYMHHTYIFTHASLFILSVHMHTSCLVVGRYSSSCIFALSPVNERLRLSCRISHHLNKHYFHFRKIK
jgi:hypothetical protein